MPRACTFRRKQNDCVHKHCRTMVEVLLWTSTRVTRTKGGIHKKASEVSVECQSNIIFLLKSLDIYTKNTSWTGDVKNIQQGKNYHRKMCTTRPLLQRLCKLRHKWISCNFFYFLSGTFLYLFGQDGVFKTAKCLTEGWPRLRHWEYPFCKIIYVFSKPWSQVGFIEHFISNPHPQLVQEPDNLHDRRVPFPYYLARGYLARG